MKILAIDIETAPNVVLTWGLWGQDVGLSQIVSTSEMICFAAKWLDSKRMHFFSVHKHGKDEMVSQAHTLLDEADVVLHYNGTRFDIPHLNREFVEAGMAPPSPFIEIDLFRTVKRKFKFQSNKLDHISHKLGLEGKLKHEGQELWVKCMAGDAAAWRRMERYNRQDVVLLEELYAILLPWIPGHPNRALHDGHHGCPRCGSTNLAKRGLRYTATSAYQLWCCADCGGYSRSTLREKGSIRAVV